MIDAGKNLAGRMPASACVLVALPSGCGANLCGSALATAPNIAMPVPGVVVESTRPFAPTSGSTRHATWIGGPDHELGPQHRYRAWRGIPLRGLHRPNNDARYVPPERLLRGQGH